MEHATEILVAMGAGIQAVNLFLAGYLLKRVDQNATNLIIHERECIKK